ncbi:MAG: hypothetical protein RLZZ511_2208 [Cyanobacteriota bacterium]
MLTSQQAIQQATEFGWTIADAKRALEGQSYPLDRAGLIQALCQYAGKELATRQRLQAAQKAQVTRKTNYIEKIETAHAVAIQEYETTLRIERSRFVAVISKIYQIAQKFGMRDLWVETLLANYDEYYQDQTDRENLPNQAA